MRSLYFTSAIIITVLLLIIAFQNIQNTARLQMLFALENVSLTFPIMLIAILGMVTGSLYTLAVQSAISAAAEEQREEEESDF